LLAVGPIRIGDEVMLGPYVVVAAGNHTRVRGSYRFAESTHEPIYVGRGTWIAAHATVLAGAVIGESCLVAANGAVPRGKYPDHVVLAGLPARVKSRLRSEKE